MKKFLIYLLLGLLLSSCTLIHRMDVEQGNIITSDMVNRLHRGMTYNQVKELMGTPVLLNTFDDNTVHYVYTFKPGNGRMTEYYLTLTFRKNILVEITCNR